jgi:hypothetical protein
MVPCAERRGMGGAANDVPGGACIVALATVRPSPSPGE